MTIKPWKVTSSHYLHPNVRIDRCELPNGHSLDALMLEYGIWVAVLALTAQGEAILIRQYRHGPRQVIWEIPGGAAEENESPLEAARRELLEETGYTGTAFIETGKISPNSATHTNSMHCFLVLDAEKVAGQELDPGEDIEVFQVPLDKLIDMAKSGEIPQALQIATLFFALTYLKRIE